MKKIKMVKISAFILCAFLFAACSKSKGEFIQNSIMEKKEFAAPKMLAARGFNSVNSDMLMESEEAVVYSDTAYDSPDTGAVQNFERKIVRTGNISLEVENLTDSETRIGEWAASYGGYITNSWEGDNRANFTVKIPSENFEKAFNETKTYGKFLNGNTNSDDITDMYYDLETRLEAKKILRDRLTGYLKNAKETKELLNIERELNNAVSEIESMEGRLRRMKDQVAYSTININLQLPYRQNSEGFEWPSWTNGFRHFAGNILDFFIGFLNVILYVIICGVPVAALLAFLFWLLFGKVGLIRKLFKKLK